MLFKFALNAPHWETTDTVTLREFLSGPVGQRLLQRLFFLRPAVTAHPRDDSMRRTQQDVLAGYEECFATLMQLASSEGISESVITQHLEQLRQQNSNTLR